MATSPDAADLIALFGSRPATPSFQTRLADLGITQPVVVDENYGSLTEKDLGLELGFEDEALFREWKEVPKGDLILVAAHLFPPGFKDFSGYSCEIPNGLSFNDKRDVVRAKMGPPAKSGGGTKFRGRLIPEWDLFVFDLYQMNVSFNPDTQSISQITLQLRK